MSVRHGVGKAFLPFLLMIPMALAGCGPASPSVRRGDHFSGQDPVDPNGPLEQMPSIYRDYGPLFAQEGTWEKEARVKPWSSYWYPLRDRRLFEGKDGKLSPLQKYDKYVRAVYGGVSASTQYEAKNLYHPYAETWEGLCHAWALVSLLYPEPSRPITAGGVTFEVSDQKALLIKAYEEAFLSYYGQRFLNHASSNWSDIQPHLFHRFVMGELIEGGRPFIMNKVPGMEVWNVPVYKASLTVKKDPARPGVYLATAVLVGATVLAEPSDQPGLQNEVNTYTYELHSRKDAEGRDFVVAGAWTGLSVDQHPSVLTLVPTRDFPHRSRNQELEWEVIRPLIYGQNLSATLAP